MTTDNLTGRMRAPAGPDVLVAFGTTCGATFQGLPTHMSLQDFRQMPIEDTGSGMTRRIITPAIRRLLEQRAAEQHEAAAGDPNENDIPAEIADSMAILYHDLKKIARGNGQDVDMMSRRYDDSETR